MTSMGEFRAELGAILRTDPTRLPAVFGGTRPRALKVGIYFDLVALYPQADAMRLRDWLGRYTSSKAYLRRLALGQHRHDLGGLDAGFIGEQVRKRARARLALLALAEPPAAPPAHAVMTSSAAEASHAV